MCRESVPLSKDEGSLLRYPDLVQATKGDKIPVSDKTIEVNSQEIRLSSLDKVMFPDDGLSKGDVVDYYLRVADSMLLHAALHSP